MENLSQLMGALPDKGSATLLYRALEGVYDRLSCQTLSTPGLAVKADGSLLVKAGTAFRAIVDGKLVYKAANTDMPVLSGTVNIAQFNVFCFFIDSGGTMTSAMGREGADIASIVFPPIPKKKAMIGFIILEGGAANAFIGNDATSGVLGTTVTTYANSCIYVNTVGAFDPTAKF